VRRDKTVSEDLGSGVCVHHLRLHGCETALGALSCRIDVLNAHDPHIQGNVSNSHYSLILAPSIYTPAQSIIHKNAQVHHLVEELESPVNVNEGDGEWKSSSEVDTLLQAQAAPQTPQRSETLSSVGSASNSSSPSGGGRNLVKTLLQKAVFLSDYDELCGRHLHKFSSQDQLQEALSMFQCRHINVPMLAIQPLDDPLHAVSAE
jgi:hypothetical protein